MGDPAISFDTGDPAAPYASPEWCLAAHTQNCALKRQVNGEVRRLKYALTSFRDERHYVRLTDRNGDAFVNWEDFVQYPEPQGLGMRADVVRAIVEEQNDARLLRDVVAAVPAAQPAIHPGPGRGKKTESNPHRFTTGSQGRLIARMKRDAPDIAERLAEGEFRSVRAAARAAGIKVEATPLELLRRAWKRASSEERETFKAEINQ